MAGGFLKRLHWTDSESGELAASIVAVYMLLLFGALWVIDVDALRWLGTGASFPFLFFAVLNLFGTAEDRKRLFTWANLVTFIRLAVLAYFTFFYLESRSGPWLSIAMVSFLALDYLDGFLARWLNQASPFGGFLDEETDSLTVLCLVTYIFRRQYFVFPFAALFVLLPGLNHYLFILVKRTFGLQWPPRQWWPRFLAGFCWLLAAVGFALPRPYREFFLFNAGLGNNFSFALSYYQMFWPGQRSSSHTEQENV